MSVTTDFASAGGRRAAAGRGARKGLSGALSAGALLLAWYAATSLFRVDPVFLPPLEAVARAIAGGFASGLFVHHLGVTFAEMALGFLLAAASGVVIGTVIAQFPLLERTVNPLIVAFQSMPKIAMAPLIIIWFGYGIGSKVVLVAFVACFPVLVSTVAGLGQCDPGRLDVLRALRASRFQLLWMVRFPSALPMIFAGLEVAAVFVAIGAIVGEFVGAKSGMGTLILYANTNMDTAQVFAILIVMAAVGLAFHRTVLEARRLIVFWGPRDSQP